MNIEQFYYVRKHVIEMLEDRGINTRRIETGYPVSIFEDMFKRFKSGLPVFDIVIEEEEKKTIVKFLFGNPEMFYKRNPESFINIQTRYYDIDLENDNVIVIICDDIADTIRNNFISKLNSLKVNAFSYKNFFMNITKHVLVPQHILLNSKDLENELAELKLNNLQQLPKMTIDDPISKYYNAKAGDVFKIIRKNRHNGNSIAFRIVV